MLSDGRIILQDFTRVDDLLRLDWEGLSTRDLLFEVLDLQESDGPVSEQNPGPRSDSKEGLTESDSSASTVKTLFWTVLMVSLTMLGKVATNEQMIYQVGLSDDDNVDDDEKDLSVAFVVDLANPPFFDDDDANSNDYVMRPI